MSNEDIHILKNRLEQNKNFNNTSTKADAMLSLKNRLRRANSKPPLPRHKKDENEVVIEDECIIDTSSSEETDKKPKEEIPSIENSDDDVDNTSFKNHKCPMCKSINKCIKPILVKRKKSFFRYKMVNLGYISVCDNCGHVNFYTDKQDELLSFLMEVSDKHIV